MALGTNYKRIGRKQDLILRIQIARVGHLGGVYGKMTRDEAVESTKGYSRKLTVGELAEILKPLEAIAKKKRPTEGKWKFVYSKGLTPTARIVSVDLLNKGYSDWICEMPFGSESEAREMGGSHIANARLIARAPELIEKLKEAEKFLKMLGVKDEIVDEINSLINKVEQTR